VNWLEFEYLAKFKTKMQISRGTLVRDFLVKLVKPKETPWAPDQGKYSIFQIFTGIFESKASLRIGQYALCTLLCYVQYLMNLHSCVLRT
jgi:hypothetical protein